MGAHDQMLPALEAPSAADWATLGLSQITPMRGGFQSLVFAARRESDDLVIKLTDSRMVDVAAFGRRVGRVSALAPLDSAVVAPVVVMGRLVNGIGDWLVVASPRVAGTAADTTNEADVRLLGRTLAQLHGSLARLETDAGLATPLPLLAPLRVPTYRQSSEPHQLLHGDFSAANVLVDDGVAHVIDFDDCGYGPTSFELGNTLFMELFDAVHSGDPDRYTRFRSWFVDSYAAESGTSFSAEVIDQAIVDRKNALAYWIDHLDEAPIGIRTSSPSWLETLRAFTRSV